MNEKKYNKLLKILRIIWATLTISFINAKIIFATGGIGTQEVTVATENIKRVIVSIAMPFRWCTNFCKCCCSSY